MSYVKHAFRLAMLVGLTVVMAVVGLACFAGYGAVTLVSYVVNH